MTIKTKIRKKYLDVVNRYTLDLDNKPFTIFCDFVIEDKEGLKHHVYMADSLGLNNEEHPNCHVNLSLYYDTYLATTIQFKNHNDAKRFVLSGGKEDNRIINKHSSSKGWIIKTKQEVLKHG